MTTKSLEDLVRSVQEQRDANLDALNYANQAALAIDMMDAGAAPATNSLFGRAWLPGALSIAAATALVVLTPPQSAHRAPPTPSAITDGGLQLEAGQWLTGRTGSSTRVHFSEQSEVGLHERARARILELEPGQISMELQNGSMHTEVTPGLDRAWKVLAGPYTVTVLGTVFDTAWDPEAEEISVRVSHGLVRVSGGSLGPEGVLLKENERVSASPASTRLVRTHLSPDQPVAGSPAAPEGAGLDQEPEAAQLAQMTSPKAQSQLKAKATPVPQQPRPPLPATEQPEAPAALTAAEVEAVVPTQVRSPRTVAELRRADDPGEALAGMTAEAINAMLRDAPMRDLMEVAGMARANRHHTVATVALATAIRNFPTDPKVHKVRFTLGKVHHNAGRNLDAISTFESFLDYSPRSHILREEAFLRLMRLHRGESGERVAKRYLEEFPEGRYRSLANEVSGSAPLR